MSTRPQRLNLPPLADPAFAPLKALIVDRTGHHYYADKDGQLWERIARRMAAIGIADPAVYLDRLTDPDLAPREWRQLETELTIKETFFFRFAEQFASLRSTILPRIIAARAESKRLRIWSAGCSTGAEPYSLAVIVRDLLGEALDNWHVSILGTDIDEAALAAAREADYGGWSLRTLQPAERERLFTSDGNRWRLRPAYRGMVRFERLNILDLLGPAAPLQLSDYDLILCRNMLIYFHPVQAARLVEEIGGRLAGDGWLLLGHAEAGLAAESGLAGVEAGGVVAYRRMGDAVPTSEADASSSSVMRSLPPPRRPQHPLARSLRPTPRTAPTTVTAPEDALGEIRRLLDSGDIDGAGMLIGRTRAEGRDSAALHYLEAMRALALGERTVAERCLRGALYLDGGFAMAHYLLGQQMAADGRTRAARRSLANAGDALMAADPDSPVAEGDGRTAGELRDAVQARLAAIP